MLTCKEVTERASLYVDRELGLWARLQFRLHLIMCQHCRRYMEQIETVVRLLRDRPTELAASETAEVLVDAFRQRQGNSTKQ
ncbi:MAG: zf-HC2 domain-containing protein [Rhodospirillales bacterium]|nr:zf-HC2 domain-containing protein [Rhodospirillales bacterium]